VLWLLEGNPLASANLRAEAKRRGIAPDRLVFALPLPADLHLARHRLADLFLDTRPVNAHTTGERRAMDGTCRSSHASTTLSPGASRRASSTRSGFPSSSRATSRQYEAIAHPRCDYTRRCERIARPPRAEPTTHPLFDTDRYRRHLEDAYETMWERSQAGLAAASFTVEPR
jgi:hypothetical protein